MFDRHHTFRLLGATTAIQFIGFITLVEPLAHSKDRQQQKRTSRHQSRPRKLFRWARGGLVSCSSKDGFFTFTRLLTSVKRACMMAKRD